MSQFIYLDLSMTNQPNDLSIIFANESGTTLSSFLQASSTS